MKQLVKAVFASIAAMLIWFALVAMLMSATRGGSESLVLLLMSLSLASPVVGGLVAAWFCPSRWYLASAIAGAVSGVMFYISSEGFSWMYIFPAVVVVSVISGSVVWGFLRWLGIGKE